MNYAPAEDRKGQNLSPGDYVRFKLYPRGTAEGVVVISKRTREVLPDGSSAPALAIDSDGTLYGMPPPKGVLKISRIERNTGDPMTRRPAPVDVELTEDELAERDERIRQELLSIIKYKLQLAKQNRDDAAMLEAEARSIRKYAKAEKWWELEDYLDDADVDSLSEVSPADLLGDDD